MVCIDSNYNFIRTLLLFFGFLNNFFFVSLGMENLILNIMLSF